MSILCAAGLTLPTVFITQEMAISGSVGTSYMSHLLQSLKTQAEALGLWDVDNPRSIVIKGSNSDTSRHVKFTEFSDIKTITKTIAKYLTVESQTAVLLQPEVPDLRQYEYRVYSQGTLPPTYICSVRTAGVGGDDDKEHEGCARDTCLVHSEILPLTYVTQVDPVCRHALPAAIAIARKAITTLSTIQVPGIWRVDMIIANSSKGSVIRVNEIECDSDTGLYDILTGNITLPIQARLLTDK